MWYNTATWARMVRALEVTVPGTDAIHGDTAITPEAASALSKQMLGEMGIGKPDQADGAGTGGGKPTEDNPGGGGGQGDPAGSNPDANANADPTGGKETASQADATWMSKLPESLQRDYKTLSPEQQAAVKTLAEGSLREDDYTRKNQQRARAESTANKKAEMLDEILSNPEARKRLLGIEAANPAVEEKPDTSISDLMKTEDPEEFSAGLDKIINDRIEAGAEARQASSPEAKAKTINDAAEKVRVALGDKVSPEAWKRASELFVEQFSSFNENWWDSDPARVGFNLRGPVRQALLEAAASANAPGSGDGGQAEGGAGVRETSIANDMGGGRTEPVIEPVKGKNADEIADAAYERTMKRFGIEGDEALGRLRSLG